MKNTYIYIITFVLFTNSLFAAPAIQKWREYKQQNGEKIKLKVIGDEYFHSYITKKNDEVKYNKKTKNFEKYKIKNNKIIYSYSPYSLKKNNDFKVNKEKLKIEKKALHLYNKIHFKEREK